MRMLALALFALVPGCAAGPGASSDAAAFGFDAHACPTMPAVVGPCDCPASARLECLGTTPALCGCVPTDGGTGDASFDATAQ